MRYFRCNITSFRIFFIVLFLFFLCTLVCAQNTKYKIQPTDVLTIKVHGHPDLTTKTRVTIDGFITFPLLEKVEVQNLTIIDIEQKIQHLLEKDYLINPQVVAFIDEYHPRQVTVMGEVNAPGKYDMPEEKDITLLEAVAMAGGFTKDAYLSKVKVVRIVDSVKKTIEIDVRDLVKREVSAEDMKDKDIILSPDDIVIVPESFF